MKEKLLALLIAAHAGVDKAILERIAEKRIAKAADNLDEEGLKTIADGVTISDIIQSEADRRATEAGASAISNYERKHSLENGKPKQPAPPAKTSPDEPPAKTNKDDLPAWAQELLTKQGEQISDMKKLIEGVVENQTLSQKQAAAKLQFDKNEVKLPATWLNRLDVDSDTSVEDQLKTLTDEFNTITQGIVDENVASGVMIPKEARASELNQEELTKIMNGDIPESGGGLPTVKLNVTDTKD